MSGFLPCLNEPVRFLAVTWDERWEFDCPSVLLEPVVRYSTCYTGPEGLIEEAVEYVTLNGEQGLPTTDEDVSGEFEWRGWSLDRLRRAAAACLAGRGLVRKKYRVVEQFFSFRLTPDGEWEAEEVAPDRPPPPTGRSP